MVMVPMPRGISHHRIPCSVLYAETVFKKSTEELRILSCCHSRRNLPDMAVAPRQKPIFNAAVLKQGTVSEQVLDATLLGRGTLFKHVDISESSE